MIFSEDNYKFMFAALQEAELAFEEDETPIGAVVVFKNKIIGRGHNQVERLKDSTAHAEIIALTSAMNHLNSKYLVDCDLYVTIEPCIMCIGAAINSKLRSVYFGAFEPKSGACGSIYNIPQENKLNHSIKIYSGIFEKEALELMQNFFKFKRNYN